jgi:DNA-binding transcriptional MerR regulator
MAPASSKRQRSFWLTSQVARRLGLSSESVRMLERRGRLPATKTATGTRLFDPVDVEREARRRERQRQPEQL